MIYLVYESNEYGKTDIILSSEQVRYIAREFKDNVYSANGEVGRIDFTLDIIEDLRDEFDEDKTDDLSSLEDVLVERGVGSSIKIPFLVELSEEKFSC